MRALTPFSVLPLSTYWQDGHGNPLFPSTVVLSRRVLVMAQVDASSVPSHPLIESDHIEGTAVYDANGKRIGSIKRLVIEKVSGHVAHAVTTFSGFLGLGYELHTIPREQLPY